MTSPLTIINPKRTRSAEGWTDLFPYYAGYPEAFANAALQSAHLRSCPLIYDPWNGSGSTTSSAAQLGFRAVGFDINPVMIVVSKARLLPKSEWTALRPLSARIILHSRAESTSALNDPLAQWFDHSSVGFIRSIERSIHAHLMEGAVVDDLSTIASALYVALFSTVRQLTRPFRSSNPTWLKFARHPEELLSISRDEVERHFLEAVERARESCRDGSLSSDNSGRVQVRRADSTLARPRRNSVDFILSSPPYCTRLDYTAATRAELAVLDPLFTGTRADLSLQMLGSVRVPKKRIKRNHLWGDEALRFLALVRRHDSHASGTYYYQTHLDYFSKLHRSLRNCAEALRPAGKMALVVQDSYYKGERNDLQRTVTEMLFELGLFCSQRSDFRTSRSMRDVNSRSKAYGPTDGVTESVLVFDKP